MPGARTYIQRWWTTIPSDFKQLQGNIGSLFLMLILVTVIAVGTVLPVMQTAIENAGASGSTATVLSIIPLFLALLVLVVFAQPLMERFR